MMKNDTLVRIEGMEALLEKLGPVEAERFIMLIQREPFDYTRWREKQFNDKSVETIFAEAAARRAQTKSSGKQPTSAPSRKSKTTKTIKKVAWRQKAGKHLV